MRDESRSIKVGSILLVSALVLAVMAAPAQAAFPGANGRISYIQGCSEEGVVRTIDPSGADGATLSDAGLQAFPGRPSWSADGSKIVFDASPWDQTRHRYARHRLFTMAADGSGLTPVPHTVGAAEAAWSPDGGKLVFIRSWSSWRSTNVFTVNADGSRARQLTEDRSYYGHPEWSPDGSLILVWRITPRGRAGIFTMAPNGSDLTPITRRIQPWSAGPDWAPDGSYIVFARQRAIWKHDMATGEETRLIRGTGNSFPSVSPDGTKLAWIHTEDVPLPVWLTTELVTAELDGSGRVVLDTASTWDCFLGTPDWQPATT